MHCSPGLFAGQSVVEPSRTYAPQRQHESTPARDLLPALLCAPKPLDAEQSTQGEAYPHRGALCARIKLYVNVQLMQRRSHSLSDHGPFHLALIAFICVLTVLLSGSSPTRRAGSDGHTRQFGGHVRHAASRNHTVLPIAPLAIACAKRHHAEVGELPELTDDDDSQHCILVVLRLDGAPFASESSLYDSSADRALSPFRLRAFSTRGSPSA